MSEEDRENWSGEQWRQFAARLAAKGVQPAVELLVQALQTTDRKSLRNLGARMQAADRVLELAGLIKPAQSAAPLASVTSIDVAKLSEEVRLAKQAERRGR